MACSGGWFLFSFMLVVFALSFRTSSSLRCIRGLGNCVDDELVNSRRLEKRDRTCRFACLGRKRETDEEKPLKNPENEKQTVVKLIDEMLPKRVPVKRARLRTSTLAPGCQRFTCVGKKRSLELSKNEVSTLNDINSKRKLSGRAGCWRFGGCKKTVGKETSSLPKVNENSEMEHQEAGQQQEDSKPGCFRFGCKKKELSGKEETGLPFAPNEKTQEIPAVDQDDAQKTRCWRFGCGKRSTHLQMLIENIARSFREKPNELEQFGQSTEQERKNSLTNDN